MYTLELQWNRDFIIKLSNSYNTLDAAVKTGKEMLSSGDGAEVKDFRVLNDEGEQVYPKHVPVTRKIDPKEIAKKYEEQKIHLYKGWINAPSILQPYHNCHGQNVIIAKIGDKCRAVLEKDLDTMAQFDIDPKYVAIGDWKK